MWASTRLSRATASRSAEWKSGSVFIGRRSGLTLQQLFVCMAGVGLRSLRAGGDRDFVRREFPSFGQPQIRGGIGIRAEKDFLRHMRQQSRPSVCTIAEVEYQE